MIEALKASLNLAFYSVDTGLDLKVISRLCCSHAGDAWTAIVNPYYCGTTFSIWAISSLICNGVAFKQFMEEFKNPFIRILFLLLGILQVLPFIWFIYCIGALLCGSRYRSNPVDLIKGTVKMKMYEAIFEGTGQMCMQMFLVMKQEQVKLGVGNLTFSECRASNSSTTSSPSSNNTSSSNTFSVLPLGVANTVVFTTMVDNLFYISIFVSLMSVSSTIVKGVTQILEKGYLWNIGYALITILAIGSRVYLKSTLGTYWDTSVWGSFNIWWLTPIIACNIASMIYTWTLRRLSCMETLKHSLAGTCDFLSKDGLPTSVSYFICSVAFAGYYWPNIHLQIALFLNAIVLVVNIVTASCFVKEPMFYSMFTNDEQEAVELT